MPKSGATVRFVGDNEPVGPKMHSAVRRLAARPYASKNQLAKRVGPHGSQDYGYRIVNRVIRRHLATLDPDNPVANPHGQGAVLLTAKGARYLNEHADYELTPEAYPPDDWSGRLSLGQHWTEREGTVVQPTEDMAPVTPRMHTALLLLADSPFPSKTALCEQMGGDLRPVRLVLTYGLAVIDADHPDADPDRAGGVLLTAKGARYLNEYTDLDLVPEAYGPAP